MNQNVNEWLDSHKQELLDDICELCSINSVKGSYEQGKPFGDGPFDALNAALAMCERFGFSIQNYESYVGTADLDPALPRSLDILAHMDVVPAGDGWTVTEPFQPVIQDGRIYGRGTSDDKGPALCALYAMRAVKECGIPLKKGVRMILGTDEECGSSDIAKYYNVEKEAEMTFTPDGEFPVINIEKGMFRGTISKQFAESTALPRLISVQAGVAVNAVPGKAVARFEGLDMNLTEDAMNEIEGQTGVHFEITGVDEITAYGKNAHASTPQEGKNALLGMVMLVGRLPLAACEQLTSLERLLKLFPYGVTDGSGLGIQMCDRASHDLTNTLDLLTVTTDSMEAVFDSRCPVMATKENCVDVATARITEEGFDFETPGLIEPHVVEGDSDFVQALLASYEAVTGRKGECIAIGGGTYVHELKNGVAFGAIMPEVDTHMHGPDEFMDIENIMQAAKIYADAIIRLCS